MKVWKILLTGGWIIYLLSFFLPVHRYGDTLANGAIPGLQALATAMTGEGGSFGIASGLTNLIMIGTLIVFLIRKQVLFRPIMPLIVIAFIINLSWLWLVDSVSDLRIGFYLWFVSYGIVATAWMLLLRSPEVATHGSMA